MDHAKHFDDEMRHQAGAAVDVSILFSTLSKLINTEIHHNRQEFRLNVAAEISERQIHKLLTTNSLFVFASHDLCLHINAMIVCLSVDPYLINRLTVADLT